MHKYKDLIIWKRSMDLATEVYKIVAGFPREEIYGLSSQIKRSVISVASNIAEGAGRNSEREFLYFLADSYGSLCELETQLLLSQNLELTKQSDIEAILQTIQELQKMVYKLQSKLKESNNIVMKEDEAQYLNFNTQIPNLNSQI